MRLFSTLPLVPLGLLSALHWLGLCSERYRTISVRTLGVDFIDENGGGPGVRLRNRQRARPAK